jgi:predicted ABC-type ATPase
MRDMPRCFLITGAIGSGKTLIAANLLSVIDIPYVSPDLYLQYLLKCQCCSAGDRYDRARKLCKERISRLTGEGRSFVWETVLSSPWKWDMLLQCEETYALTIIFLEVGTSQVCVQRAQRRAAAGWYEVHSAKIIDSYEKMSLARPHLEKLADMFIPLDNSEDLV